MPDAGREVHLLAAGQEERQFEGGGQVLGHPHRLLGVGDVLEQHHELVAPEPGHRVRLVDRRPEPVAEGHQHLVAHAVAQAVVHDLEAVDVAEQHRHLGVGADPSGQRLVETVEQQGAVGQVGERIVQGLVGQPGLVLGALQGDGHERAGRVSDPALVLGRLVERAVQRGQRAHGPARADGHDGLGPCCVQALAGGQAPQRLGDAGSGQVGHRDGHPVEQGRVAEAPLAPADGLAYPAFTAAGARPASTARRAPSRR